MNDSIKLGRARAAITAALFVIASSAAGQGIINADATDTSASRQAGSGNDPASGARRGADFVNGGITQEEADQLRSQARAYALEIQFSRRIDSADAFAAGVHVRITNASGDFVMVLPAADPILLANLPPGRYTVEATYEGQTKRQHVTLGRGHQKLGFQW